MVRPAPGAAVSTAAPAPSTGASPTIHLNAWRRIAPAVTALAWGGNHFTPLLLMYTSGRGLHDRSSRSLLRRVRRRNRARLFPR